MTIDKIEPLDKRRCKVFLDGDFAFVLYKGELAHFEIEEGGELNPVSYEQILSEVICKRTRERALYILQFSGKTEAELSRKLRAAFYPERAISEAVAFLKRYHYLDDETFARNYIEACGKRKSRSELMAALRRKGVERECAERLLSELEPDEAEQVKNLLHKRGYSENLPAEKKRKVIAAVMRRGFSYETIRSVIGDFSLGEEID